MTNIDIMGNCSNCFRKVISSAGCTCQNNVTQREVSTIAYMFAVQPKSPPTGAANQYDFHDNSYEVQVFRIFEYRPNMGPNKKEKKLNT